MKKTALVPALVVLLSGCTFTPISSSVAASSSPAAPSSTATPSSTVSSSEGPKVLEAPTIDKVAAVIDNSMEVGLSSYTYSNRSMKWNYRFGYYNDNTYYTIDAKQYKNGSDSVKTVYYGNTNDLTFEDVYSTGALKTYKLDENYYVYGYVSNRVNMDQTDDFVEVLERNRYNDETTMEYWSNALGVIQDCFDGTSIWPESSGYTNYEMTAELVEDYYYCEIKATAPETDQYPEEDNYAWVKLDAYTYTLNEIGVHMQSICPQSTDYAGELLSLTEVTLKNIVTAPLVEAEIEPFDLEKVPAYLVNDFRSSFVELPEGEISQANVIDVLKNMRSYSKGTNYAHREFSQEIGHYDYEAKQYVVDYNASCFEDYYAVVDESMTVHSYMDDDNDPSTPHALQQAAINYCTDEGIVTAMLSPVATDYMPQYTSSYTYAGSNVYSLDDYLNPNGYYNGFYAVIFSEVARYGWGTHDNGWSTFEYELVTATNVNGVIDIEFHINFDATDYQEAYTDVYKIQITNNFCNMIAKKTNGAADFDTFYNYKIEPMGY